jgi:isoleucyl-tRNA synthetase
LNDNFEELKLEKINIKELPELEQFMLHKIYTLNANFKNNFYKYDFHNLYKELLNFCTVDLSAFYFDIRKDILYCDPINSGKRKSTIILLKIILDSLLKWFAPILSFTTEEIYRLIKQNDKSIHLEKFINFPNSFENSELNKKWQKLIQIRDVSNISIEEKRSLKEIGSSLEANIEIKLNKEYFEISKNIDFSELCITSKASIIESSDKNIIVETTKAKGSKCPVCWKISIEPCKRHS